jgi:prefoldin subunit 5
MAFNGASFNKSESESQTSKQFATTVSRLNSKQMFDEVTRSNPFEGNSVLMGDIMLNVKNGLKIDEDIYETVLRLETKMDTIITLLSKLSCEDTVGR